jgi:hypothetical protein
LAGCSGRMGAARYELRAASYEPNSRRPAAEKRRGWADEGVCPYVSLAPGRRGVCAYVRLNLDGCKTMPLKVERDVD